MRKYFSLSQFKTNFFFKLAHGAFHTVRCNIFFSCSPCKTNFFFELADGASHTVRCDIFFSCSQCKTNFFFELADRASYTVRCNISYFSSQFKTNFFFELADGASHTVRGEIFVTPVPSLKLISFSNWRTARPIQFDVKLFTHVASLKLTSFLKFSYCDWWTGASGILMYQY